MSKERIPKPPPPPKCVNWKGEPISDEVSTSMDVAALWKQKMILTLFLFITVFLLAGFSYRVKQLESKIEFMETDYKILLEMCNEPK